MYIKLSFIVYEHRFNFLLINLVKLHNTPYIGGQTTTKTLFSRKTEKTKISNIFDLHHMLLKVATLHENKIFIILNFSQNLCVN